MSDYVIGQRYLSEAEPELGLGRIEAVENRQVVVRFPASASLRRYATGSAPLKRVAFRVGDEIADENGAPMEVDAVEERDGLLVYVGAGRRLSETKLDGRLRFSKPEERLLGGHWDESKTFALRRRTRVLQYRSRKSRARGFAGARIELLPHQLYIAQEVAARPSPRALLSDEVGLGKTIEAGLILHRLLRSGQIARVLILVPESLVHQWFVEMLRRFHLAFTIADEPFCRAVSGNPFLETQTAIVDIDWVPSHRDRRAELVEAGWDMVVVDEAHHLELADPPSPAYALVERLGRDARGLLLLTATPEQLGAESHFARLRLLDPGRYPSFERYRNEARHYRQVAELAGSLLEGGALGAADAEELVRLLPEGARRTKGQVQSHLAGDEAAGKALLADLLDHHGPGRVVFRNTRKVLDRVPGRRVHGVPLRWPSERAARRRQAEQLERELLADAGAAGASAVPDYGDDVRARWLIELFRELAPEKVLVLCRTKERALALHEVVRVQSRVRAGLFHEGLTLLQRDKNAAWFADRDEGAQALLCSEIGSEGRNFQFAHHLVLFDLPLETDLLEQRIGRLYRIGQDQEVQIHVPYLEGSPQERVFRWYHEGLDAFEKGLPSGACFVEPAELLAELVLESFDGPEGKEGRERCAKDFDLLLQRTREYRDEVARKLEAGRDPLLELGSFRPDVARDLIQEIGEWDRDRELDRYVADVLDHFGVELEEVSPRTFVLRKGSQLIVDDLPGLRGDEVGMTADRDKATHQGELDFLTWDHPLVSGVMELLLSSEQGNSAVALLPSPNGEGFLLEALFVLDAVALPSLYIDRFLPPTPLRVVVDGDGRDVTAGYPAEPLDKELRDARKLLRFTGRSWQDAPVARMVTVSERLAERVARERIAAGLSEMRNVMDRELHRLKRLLEVNDRVRPEEIEDLETETRALADAIGGAKLRLEALRLIWKVSR